MKNKTEKTALNISRRILVTSVVSKPAVYASALCAQLLVFRFGFFLSLRIFYHNQVTNDKTYDKISIWINLLIIK